MARVTEKVLLASAIRTTTQTLDAQNNPDQLGEILSIEVALNLTVIETAASLILSIEENVEGAWETVLSSAEITALGITRLQWGPTAPISANAAANGLLARQFRVVVTHGNANDMTYTVTEKQLRS